MGNKRNRLSGDVSMTSSSRLTKSSKEKLIFGVAGGMAEYFDVDPVLMRVVFVLVGLVSGGTAILAYIILAIVMPSDGDVEDDDSEDGSSSVRRPRSSMQRRNLLAMILIVVGVLALTAQIGFLSWWNWSIFWPVVIIALGLAIIVSRTGRA
jgi:phage shock protein PspC (stress-responsive transcriptional regulator)